MSENAVAHRDDLRNVAIVAHVDHGKTTLVDAMLRQTNSFAAHEHVEERAMDSNELEREKGITILAKNTAISYNGKHADKGPITINVIDTPGHADFGGEVERGLSMVDGVVLLVDASEGPLPQTRFVLRKALEAKLPVILAVNKTDRPDARIEEVVSESQDLLLGLASDLADDVPDLDLDAILDVPVVYASGRNGAASRNQPENGELPDNDDLEPLFEAILEHIPAPTYDPEAPLQAHVTNLDASPFLGRLALLRIFNGTLKKGQTVAWVRHDGDVHNVRVTELMITKALDRYPAESAGPGDIVAVAGFADIMIGDTLADPDDIRPLPAIHVDEPAISMTIGTNTSPLVGKVKGHKLTARMVKDRLDRELIGNVSLRVLDIGRPDAWEVQGRGELALAILVEQMRREGYELTVGKPQVVTKRVDGKLQEPYEHLTIDAPEEYLGAITQLLASPQGPHGEHVEPRHRLGPHGVHRPVARPDRLPHRVPDHDPRHRHRQRHRARLRRLGRPDRHAQQRLDRGRPLRCGHSVRHHRPAGAHDVLREPHGGGLRGHGHRRELACRRHGREHHQGEEADEHASVDGRQLRVDDAVASADARGVPRVRPRRRVRRGDPGGRPHPQGRARRERPRSRHVAPQEAGPERLIRTYA